MEYVVHESDNSKMLQYKLQVEDGQYSAYCYLDLKTMKESEYQPEIHPVFN